MGYIQKGAGVQIEASYTQKGREILQKGNKADLKVAFFSLGDSDANYMVGVRNENVVDVTGDADGCVKSVAKNVNIKYNLNK